MKDDFFISTTNFQKMQALSSRLLANTLNVELAAVVGRAGRGKTRAAERIYTHSPSADYVRCGEKFSHVQLLREITFKVCGSRPHLREKCLDLLKDELADRRRIIILDEADRLNISCLNMARDIHDECDTPVLLVGEEILLKKLNQEERLISRVREIIRFEPASQADVVIYFKQAIEQTLSPAQAVKILMTSKGDLRNIKTTALLTEDIMKSSGLSRVTDDIIDRALTEFREKRLQKE